MTQNETSVPRALLDAMRDEATTLSFYRDGSGVHHRALTLLEPHGFSFDRHRDEYRDNIPGHATPLDATFRPQAGALSTYLGGELVTGPKRLVDRGAKGIQGLNFNTGPIRQDALLACDNLPAEKSLLLANAFASYWQDIGLPEIRPTQDVEDHRELPWIWQIGGERGISVVRIPVLLDRMGSHLVVSQLRFWWNESTGQRYIKHAI